MTGPCTAPRPLFPGRLRRFEEFQTVMRQGSYLAGSEHFALHLHLTTPPKMVQSHALLLGALLPKRHAKRAVTRNLLRRQIYAVTAAHLPQLAQAALATQTQAGLVSCVLRLRKAYAGAEFTSASSSQLSLAVRNELLALHAKALQKMAAPALAHVLGN